jgi:hypothetical protein
MKNLPLTNLSARHWVGAKPPPGGAVGGCSGLWPEMGAS